MAGEIFLSKEVRIPLSTRQFDYLVERIRLEFEESEQGFLREIYSPMDEGAMTFISAEEQGVVGFMAFFKAITRARQKASTEDNYETYQPLWDELFRKARSDPRAGL